MAEVVVTIPAQTFTYDLDGYEDMKDENGEWDMDSLYDGFVHDAIQQIDFDWKVNG